MKKNTRNIFLSYSWKDSELANTIDDELCKLGFVVSRDIRDIGDWKSIKDFMSSIRNQDYAVIIISPNYLKSPNCMYEVTELLKDSHYKNKILSIVTEETDLYNPVVRAKYIKFWEEETKKLEESIKPLKMENIAELTMVLRQYKSIEMNIASFLELVSDKNNPQIVDAVNKIEKFVLCNDNIPNCNEEKYKNNIKLRLKACHYAYLKFAAIGDISGTEIEKMIGIKELNSDEQNEYDLPMLTCEVTNCSTQTRIIEEPTINGEIKLNNDSIQGMGFIIMPNEMKKIEPGGKVKFNLHGKIMINLICAFFEGKIENITVKDNFGFCYYVPQEQINEAINYFKRYCFDIEKLQNQHDKYCL